ncbi:MAG: hypothetical protein HPY45_02610 [Anaerolineae bacterium]|nr:hypothetical protein [Anaerolineae bacterium]
MASSIDLVWVFVGFLFTVLILSYVLGDNPFFRLASYVFVGISSAYLVVLLIYQVILPRLVQPFFETSSSQLVLHLVLFVMCLLLLTKLSPRLARFGNIPMAYLVGAGTAVVIGGAVLGTIITQVKATVAYRSASAEIMPGIRVLEGLVILLGTVVTLAYFHFGARTKTEGETPSRPLWLEMLSYLGRFFIAVTFGALFVSVYVSALTALIERLSFIIQSVPMLLKGLG